MKKFFYAFIPLFFLSACAQNASWNVYATPVFQFEYPSDLPVQSQDLGYRISELEQYQPKTNLTAAHIDIWVDQKEKCKVKIYGVSAGPTEKISLNGMTFDRDVFRNSAAGIDGESVLYSAVSGEKCYKILFVMISMRVLGSSENLPPAFDRSKILEIFEKVVRSFRITGSELTN